MANTSASLNPRNLQQIRGRDEVLGNCLKDIVDAHNNVAQQVNASPVGITPSPQSHAALSVVGGGGYFSATITDNSDSFRGKEHFLVASEDKSFGSGGHMIHLGASKTWYGYLGPKVLHFASYPSYPTTGPAQPIYQYSVNGAAAAVPPLPTHQDALVGWGTQPYTTDTVPIR